MVPYPCLDCLLGLYAETFMCSPSTWQGQTACQLSASHLYASYSYANTYFPWAYHYMRPEWGLGVLRVNMWKYCVLTPKRHYPASVAVSHDKIGSTALALGPWKDFCVQRKKNWVVTLAIWREVTPCVILTKCGMWADMVDVITCAIFGDCRLRGVRVVTGTIFHWLEVSPLQHWSPCDRVIWLEAYG